MSTAKQTAETSLRRSIFSGEVAAVGDGLRAGNEQADVLVTRGLGVSGALEAVVSTAKQTA